MTGADPSAVPSSSHAAGILTAGEDLRNGIWPKTAPLWLAGVYVALFIIRPWEEIFPWMGTIKFERIYAVLMISVVLLSSKTRIRFSFQSLCVVFLLLAMVLSAAFALDSGQAWPVVYQYLTVVIFFFVLLACIRSPYDLVFIASCYILTMFIYLAKSQWEYWVHGQNVYDMGVVRLVGIETTFGGPNSLAMSIVAAFPVWLFLRQVRTQFCATWPQHYAKWYARILKGYVLLAVLSLIFTNSRSGMLGGLLFLVFTIMRGRGFARKIVFLLGGIALISAIWLFLPKDTKIRYMTIVDASVGPQNAQVSAEGRIGGFKAGVEMFRKYPFLGVGIGNFIQYRMTQGDGVNLNAHNLVGQVLGETGLAGGITFMMMVGWTLVNTRRLHNLRHDFVEDDLLRVLDLLGVAVRTSVLLLLFEGLFGHNLKRFNWLWLAAFADLGLNYAKERCRIRLEGERP